VEYLASFFKLVERYSIYEPEVLCISKGKEHKQYEFGNKSSFAYTRGSGIIVGAMAIDGNS